MIVSIWGCRGSIARSHKDLIRYGGNTSCVEVETESTRIVLDMGSGAYDLGQKLVKKGKLTNQHILLSHTHSDHIQGFPFFSPFFIKGSEWHVHAPGGFADTIRDKLSTQMSHEFFPLSIDQLEANISYHDLKEGELQVGDIHVVTQYLNHNVLTLGYRLEAADGTSIAYCTDHEPYDRTLATKGYQRNPDNPVTTPDDKHADFFAGVDLLIHDTQYVASEYSKTEGYGHSTMEYVVDMCLAVGVKKLALFHHDPNRTDEQVDDILKMAQDRVKAANGTLEVIAASDNSSLTLENLDGMHRKPKAAVTESTKPMVLDDVEESTKRSAFTQPMSSPQEVVISHPMREPFEGLENDGVEAVHVVDDESFVERVLKRQPSLVLVRHTGDSDTVIENCKRVRLNGGEWGHAVPYLVTVPNQATLEAVKQKGDTAGVTDWVVEPFKKSYIRTRIRMGIARMTCRWKPPPFPDNEAARMKALRNLRILDTPPEKRFDRITSLCSKVFDVPLVLISLVDTNRQWFKSAAWHCPIPGGGKQAPRETPRDISFCGHSILSDSIHVVQDATQDERFADNPLVADVDGLKIRFYCGCPLQVPDVNSGREVSKYRIGTLCLIDQRPRDIDDHQKSLLKDFAGMVEQEMLNFKLNDAKMQESVRTTKKAMQRPSPALIA